MLTRLLLLLRIHIFTPLYLEKFSLRRFLRIRFGLLENTYQVTISKTRGLKLACEFLPRLSLSYILSIKNKTILPFFQRSQIDLLSAFRDVTPDPPPSPSDGGLSKPLKIAIGVIATIIAIIVIIMIVRCCQGKEPCGGLVCVS